MDRAVSGRNSDQQEHIEHYEATVFYWPQHDFNSLSVLTLGRILCVGKVKKISFGHIYSKNKLPTTWQHLFVLQELVYDYLPVQFVLPLVYPLGVQAHDESHTQCYLPRCPTSGSKRASLKYTKTLILAKVSGWGQVQLSWEMPINTFKCPHPHPTRMRWLLSLSLHPKNPSWEISQAASVLLKSLGVVASGGRLSPNGLQVLHISQNAIDACLSERSGPCQRTLLQLWHPRPQLAVDLGLGSKASAPVRSAPSSSTLPGWSIF